MPAQPKSVNSGKAPPRMELGWQRAPLHLGDDAVHVRICHLQRRQQGQPRLLMCRLCAAATHRHTIGGAERASGIVARRASQVAGGGKSPVEEQRASDPRQFGRSRCFLEGAGVERSRSVTGLASRDRALRDNGEAPMGDLTHTLKIDE